VSALAIRVETVRRQLQEVQKMAKDHGPSVKNDKQYEALRKKGMSKSRAASIANAEGSSKRGGEHSHGGGSARSRKSTGPGSGGNIAQKAAAGRKGGKAKSS
jgi:hypothetical protein